MSAFVGTWTAEDNGEPGKGNDRFRIRLDGPTTYDSDAVAPNGGLFPATSRSTSTRLADSAQPPRLKAERHSLTPRGDMARVTVRYCAF